MDMTSQDGRPNVGDKCIRPECDRILYRNSSICPKHDSSRIVSDGPDPVINQPTDTHTKKRLCGPEARFVAKKSESVLRRGSSKRSSASDQSQKSPEATTKGIPSLYTKATTRKPTTSRSDSASESSGARRRDISDMLPKSPAKILSHKAPGKVLLHGGVSLQAQNEVSKHRAVTGDKRSSEDITAENPVRFSIIETEVLKIRHDFEIHKRKPIDDAKKSAAGPPLPQNLIARKNPTIADEFNDQPQTGDSYSFRQRKWPSEDPSKHHVPSQISEESIQKHVVTKPSLGNPESFHTTTKARSLSALSLPPAPIIQKFSNRCNTRHSSEPQAIDSSRALNKRYFRAVSQDDSDNAVDGSTQTQLPQKSRIELLLDQRALNRLRLPVVPEQSHGALSSGDGQKIGMSLRGAMSLANDLRPKAGVDIEERRRLKLARFDSDAFDTMIYQQSSTQPPEGVLVSRRLPNRMTTLSEDRRLALPVDPTIHGMHKRPEEWIQKKSKEIAKRGGRKAWFGKPIERKRWLRAQEAAKEKEREKARKAKKPPPRKDPEPWECQRVLNLGDLAEEDLPEHVRENAGWAKACASMRIHTQRTVHRQRKLEMVAEETRSFYMDVLSRHAA